MIARIPTRRVKGKERARRLDIPLTARDRAIIVIAAAVAGRTPTDWARGVLLAEVRRLGYPILE